MIVTATDRNYLPGLIALHNSVLANSPGTPLACLVHGDDELAEQVQARGIRVIHNPAIGVPIPTGGHWPEPLPAMYSRLLIPHLVEGPALWLDADCIVLQPLDELFELELGEAPCAMVDPQKQTLHDQVGGYGGPSCRACFNGLILFNGPAWRAKSVTERCRAAMTLPYVWKYAVQSVMSYVLRGDWVNLPYRWNVFANRGPLPADTAIVHYVGGVPWGDPALPRGTVKMQNLEVWNRYA